MSDTVSEKKKQSLAKSFVWVVVFIILAWGIVASLRNSIFDMTKTIEFLKSYSPVLIPLILGIALGRGAKNYFAAKYGNGTETKPDA
jgi:hypothetical protein